MPIRRAGAKGVLTKSKATSELTPALRAIIGGQTYFH
jgi:DNA-binding NarL/FixJ family response regulator